MKSIHRTAVLATAALAVGIATASAQSQVSMSVSVPFAFTAGGQVMPAGDYRIPLNAGRTVLIADQGNRHTQWINSAVPTETKADYKPRVVFSCRGEHCTLREVHPGYTTTGYQLPVKRSKSDSQELAKVVVLSATLTHAD